MLDKYDAQSTNLTQQKTNSESVQNKNFLFFYKSFTNPYSNCSESTKKNCTDVRNNVQFLYSFEKRKFHKIRRKSQRIYSQMKHRIHEHFNCCQSNRTIHCASYIVGAVFNRDYPPSIVARGLRASHLIEMEHGGAQRPGESWRIPHAYSSNGIHTVDLALIWGTPNED